MKLLQPLQQASDIRITQLGYGRSLPDIDHGGVKRRQNAPHVFPELSIKDVNRIGRIQLRGLSREVCHHPVSGDY